MVSQGSKAPPRARHTGPQTQLGQRPPQQLSLRRLFVYLSVICLVCAAVARYPQAVALVATNIVRLVGWIGPTLLVCGMLATHCHRPNLTLMAAIGGATMGMFLAPGWHSNLLEPAVLWMLGFHASWQAWKGMGWLDMLLPPLLAAVVGGAACWVSRVGNQAREARRK